MRLSLEIPTAMYKDIGPLCDLDFILAQEVNDNPDYRLAYRTRFHSECIMDNGFHERNLHPLEPIELLDAARSALPDYVIAPDFYRDAKATWDGYKRMKAAFQHHDFNIAVVMHGKDSAERNMLFENLRRDDTIGMLCFPYREPRYDWFVDLLGVFGTEALRWPGGGRIHLLGMQTCEELRKWNKLWYRIGWDLDMLSMDTGKPIKWGLKGKLIELSDNLHGGGLIDHQIQLWEPHRADIYRNIAYMRKFM